MARLKISLRLAVLTIASAVVAVLAAIWYFQPFPPIGYGRIREAEVFKDCSVCPEMLPIPPGRLVMDLNSRSEYWLFLFGLSDEPKRIVTMDRAFAIGRYELTFSEWDACVADGGCAGYNPPDEGWGRDRRPVIHVSWNDAQAYVHWLSAKTGHAYRLPTEAEWEYAARAGTITPYSWGRFPSHHWANYGDERCPPCTGLVSGRDTWMNTAPVGQFPPNTLGLYDMHGNVYEWAEDCFVANLPKVATDGSPVRALPCEYHTLRGGAWYSDSHRITTTYRAYNRPDKRDAVIGFRVARSLDAP